MPRQVQPNDVCKIANISEKEYFPNLLSKQIHPETHNLLVTCSHHTFLWFHATEYSLLQSKDFSRLNHPFYAPKRLEDSYKAHSNHIMTKHR